MLPARHPRGRPPGAGALAGQRHRAGAGRARRRRRRWPVPAARTSRWSRPSSSGCCWARRCRWPGSPRCCWAAPPRPPACSTAARAAGVPVVTTYGMTETCGGCVYDGVPLDGVRVAIRGDDDDSRRGRIWIGGPVLFSGYRGRRRPGGLRDGWFRTGDLGRLDSSGRLVVRGRADDVINTGGHKVVPGEVAAALQTCPGVRDVAVLGQPDPRMGRTGRSGRGAGRSGRPAGAGIAPSACAGAAAALRCSKQGRNGRCRSHAPEREARHRTAQARAATAGTN